MLWAISEGESTRPESTFRGLAKKKRRKGPRERPGDREKSAVRKKSRESEWQQVQAGKEKVLNYLFFEGMEREEEGCHGEKGWSNR